MKRTSTPLMIIREIPRFDHMLRFIEDAIGTRGRWFRSYRKVGGKGM